MAGPYEDPGSYNDPAGGSPSTIGSQINTYYYQRKALIEMKREQMFQPLASTIAMPKNMGKKIRRNVYIPLLDDQNINSQGIDASGAVIADGNLYGSSKDIGTIVGKMPLLQEHGGRVNRVGFHRREIEGTFENYGFFSEYTEDSVHFDTDSDLMMHINRETLFGANEIVEDLLQIDLINNAGVVRYPGNAVDMAGVGLTRITYRDLLRLHIDLNQNRTPLKTKVVTGTRNIDTMTIPSGRVMYIGSELQPMFEEMVDLHGERAFIPVQKYGAGTTPMNGEIGTVGHFRLLVNQEMMNWSGQGADATGEPDYYQENGKFNVFPMLVVGTESFTTVGWMSDGKVAKFKIYHRPPGEGAVTREDPYGKTGLMSLQFWYGFMPLRSERLALVYSAAEM